MWWWCTALWALAGPSAPATLSWTGAALGTAGLGVELWALAHQRPGWFAAGLSAEVIGLPMVAGGGLWAAGRREPRPSLAPGLLALGLWGTGLGIKAVWRTTGPESLGPLSLAVFVGAYAAGGLQWVGLGRIEGTLQPRWGPEPGLVLHLRPRSSLD